jgi:hypothetical protein
MSSIRLSHQRGSVAPVSAMSAPAAPGEEQAQHDPAPQGAKRRTAAPARMPYCHGSERARASGIAVPRMAPIAAGPAPLRKALAFSSARSRSKEVAPRRTKANLDRVQELSASASGSG